MYFLKVPAFCNLVQCAVSYSSPKRASPKWLELSNLISVIFAQVLSHNPDILLISCLFQDVDDKLQFGKVQLFGSNFCDQKRVWLQSEYRNQFFVGFHDFILCCDQSFWPFRPLFSSSEVPLERLRCLLPEYVHFMGLIFQLSKLDALESTVKYRLYLENPF